MSVKAQLFTWDIIVRKWNKNQSHPMIDCGSRDFDGPWELFGPITLYEEEQWLAGLAAHDIYPTSVWLGERVRPKGEVIILNIKNDQIFFIKSTTSDLFLNYPLLIPSRQHGALSWQYSHMPFVAPIMRSIERIKLSLCIIALGPRIEDMQAVPGKSSSQFALVNDGNIDYEFCRVPNGSQRLIVSDFVKVAWQRLFYVKPVKTDFLSLEYYKQGQEYYSAWSFTRHGSQVVTALENIKKDTVIVAPGDGYGIASKNLSHLVISGDLVVNYPSSDVIRESFRETMVRGKKFGKDKPLLLLSYVYSLMSQDDKSFSHNWDGPVVIIDSHFSDFPGAVKIGPGIQVCNLSLEEYPCQRLEVTEGFEEPYTAFSENLLRLPMLYNGYDNSTYRYWVSMRPLAPTTSDVDKGSIVASTLYEACTYSSQTKRRVWLAKIGKFMEPSLPVSISPNMELRTRTVYRIPAKDPICLQLQNKVHYYQFEGFFLFCVSSPKSMQIHFEHGKGNIIFHEKARDMRVVRLGHVTLSSIVWNVQGTPVVWERNNMTTSLSVLYLREYGGGDFWENKLDCHGWDFSLCSDVEKNQINLLQEYSDPDPSFTPYGWIDGWWPEVFSDFAVLSKVPCRSLSSLNDIVSGYKCNICFTGLRWSEIYSVNGSRDLPLGYLTFSCICVQCYSLDSTVVEHNKRYTKFRLMVRQCEDCLALMDLSHFESYDSKVVCFDCQMT